MVPSAMWMDFVNQNLHPYHQHIHTGILQQFSDVNVVTYSTMTDHTMANTVWKMLFLPLENQLQFLIVSSL
jgi:hypothetical protein